jgi:[acyl-carrier-protein] S-malonyltransferase
MAQRELDTVIESGPGKVLAGLNKRIDRSIKGLAVYDPASLESAMETVNA